MTKMHLEVKQLSEHPMCPICRDRMFFLFSVPCDYRKPSNSKLYNIYWCTKCNYGQVWGRPKNEEVIDFYKVDNYYTHDSQITINHYKKETFLDRLRLHIAWRFDQGQDLNPLDVIPILNGQDFTFCEIGCGNGKNLLKFFHEGFSVIGVEPDPIARDTAKKTIESVLDGTAEELPKTVLKSKYDVVLMSHVLEHCLDINLAISNIKKILRPNGVFIVETPNCNSYGFNDYKGEWPWSDIPRHLNFFTLSSLNSILAKYSFRIITVQYYGFCRQFSNSWIENEKKIWHTFADFNSERKYSPNFKLRAWKLLLRSIFSSKSCKYDSVRVVAIKT